MQTWQFISPLEKKSISTIPRVKAVSHLPDLLSHSNAITEHSEQKNQYAVVKSISNISNSMSHLINTIKKSIQNIYPSHNNIPHCTTYSSTQTILPNTWRWFTPIKWQDFMPIISTQIDECIHYQWRNTNNNPIIFQLTSGSWIGDNSGRNIYSVHVDLDQTRTTIINIYRINNNTKIINKMKRSTLCPLLPPFIPDYKCNKLIQSTHNCQMDIIQFRYVGKQSKNLVFGYIRLLEDEIILSRNISLSVYQICAIFYSGINIKLGIKIDVCDRSGKWFLAEIKQHKKLGETMEFKDVELTNAQQKNIVSLCKLEAVFIHYVGHEVLYDEWIFIRDNTICRCHGQCVSSIYKHRLAAPNTQSKLCNPN
eukprot:503213_1